jgi:hypothetical protein
MIAAGHDHSLPWPAGQGLEAQHARFSGVLDALGELARVSLGAFDEGQLNLAPLAMVTQHLINMHAHHSEMPVALKDALKAKIASIAALVLQTVPPAWTGVDDCIAQFFKALKEVSRALPTTVAVFVRLALDNPDAVIPALPLDCWQMENAAISSVGELRAVVAQLRAYKAVSCQKDGCQYAMRCICRNGGGG